MPGAPGEVGVDQPGQFLGKAAVKEQFALRREVVEEAIQPVAERVLAEAL